MCNKENLPDRVEKAKAAMLFAKVSQYDTEGKAKSVYVPGSEGKQYQVIIRRRNGQMSTELLLIVNNQQVKPIYANKLTYHAMAAIMISAKESGYRVCWTSCRQDAVRLSKINGSVFHFSNFDNKEEIMWGIFIPLDK